MNLPTAILGTTAVTKLKETASSWVLSVGSDHLTRAELAGVGCYNFLAARLLSHILNGELKVPNLKHVYEKVPPAQLALPHLGVVSLAVLGAAFEAKRLGDLESYVERHRVDGRKTVTFDTIKHRDQMEAARERAEKKRRKGARRNKAHQLRVERFDERQQQTG